MPDLENNPAAADEGQRALLSNLAAVRAVCGAVEGTLGPKGLDCLLVEDGGEAILTNDGVTILRRLALDHPAARLLIQAARAQDREVGDGTTTATILAGALIEEGASQVIRGVPATRVVEGIRAGLAEAQAALAGMRRPVAGLADPVLTAVALVAGRGDAGLAETVLAAAECVGAARLMEEGYSFAAAVLGMEDATDQAFPGIIVEREPVAPEMPARLDEAVVLVLEGALESEPVPAEALSSAAGLARAEERRAAFRTVLQHLASSGVNLILAGRNISDGAAQFLADAGLLAFRRVAERDLRRVAAFTGARIVRHLAEQSTWASVLGRAALAEIDRRFNLLRLSGGRGVPEVTLVVGGGTGEVVAERERIARDAAAAVQQALRGGVVPGGGAAELGAARSLARSGSAGLNAYGMACVREALKRPLAQLAANAGYNPLEKVEEAYAAQENGDSPCLGIEAETGRVCDLTEAGIWDPYPVKQNALRTAGEIATAILRINCILRMRSGSRDEDGWHDPQ